MYFIVYNAARWPTFLSKHAHKLCRPFVKHQARPRKPKKETCKKPLRNVKPLLSSDFNIHSMLHFESQAFVPPISHLMQHVQGSLGIIILLQGRLVQYVYVLSKRAGGVRTIKVFQIY